MSNTEAKKGETKDEAKAPASSNVFSDVKQAIVQTLDEEKQKKIRDPTLDRRTLFVRSIPDDATNEELSEFFSQYVPVKHAVIVMDKEGKSRGFGFVSFTSDEDALTALAESKKSKFKEKKLLRVDVAKRRERKKEKDGAEKPGAEKPGAEKPAEKPIRSKDGKDPKVLQKTANLIVRNLPWSVKTGDDLIPIFEKFGKVKEARVPKKKDGRMCGFAFVTMSKHSAAAKAAKECVGLKIAGRPVAVDLAVDKTNWENYKKNQKDESEKTKKRAYEEADEEDDDEEKEEADGSIEADEEADEEVDDEADEKLNFEDDEDEEDNRHAKGSRKPKNRQERYSIFIRNLPYDVTKETLSTHFEKLGEIKYALPVIDRETGLARGTGFVAFKKRQPYEECLMNAPDVPKDSVLLPDDVSPFYVFDGRVMQVAPAVDRDSAAKLAERHSEARRELLGREPKERDRRRLFLLNEGRISPTSKLAEILSKADMDIRDKSYELRVKQLNSNPSLHLSMTRLAIRNIPRAMNEKALKALGRKAVVEFAKEVKSGQRHPLNKEELDRSTKHKEYVEEKIGIPEGENHKKKHGLVTQSKIINEVKGSGEYGRSRGYGFLEFKDHRSALMALRWLNGHEVSREEIVNDLTDEQKEIAENEKLIAKKRLVVEFAIENAAVIKRRLEQIAKSRKISKRQREHPEKYAEEQARKRARNESGRRSDRPRHSHKDHGDSRGDYRGQDRRGDRDGDRRGGRGGDRRGGRGGDRRGGRGGRGDRGGDRRGKEFRSRGSDKGSKRFSRKMQNAKTE